MAGKKNKDYYLSEEDKELFLHAFRHGSIDPNDAASTKTSLKEREMFLEAVALGKVYSSKKEIEPKKNIVKKLKKNKEIDAKIDLHGMYLEDAVLALYHFLDRQKRLGKKVVLVVHGKGAGILREGALGVISTHPAVFNFKVAPFRHGGDGAMIVWLR